MTGTFGSQNKNNHSFNKSDGSYKSAKQRLKHVILNCHKNIGDEAERDLEKGVIFEQVRFDRLNETIQFFEEYNYMNAHQLMMLGRIK